MRIADYVISIVFIVALAVIAIFWGCHLDPIVTVIGAVVVIAAITTTIVQNKKMKEIRA